MGEAVVGGDNYNDLVVRGIPFRPGQYLKFQPWNPTVLYSKTFPPSCQGMVYLRAELPKEDARLPSCLP